MFTPLPPGWVNVYQWEEGKYETAPCPGVLTQASGEETRTVYVESVWPDDSAGGQLFAAYINASYVYTTTAENWALQFLSMYERAKQSGQKPPTCQFPRVPE
ncbi:hypothetical protein A5670_22825 [Mycolicibacterium fortuitum]|nr:hypothetical protein A5670_22825 [Mycolicibacterium fortuitum]